MTTTKNKTKYIFPVWLIFIALAIFYPSFKTVQAYVGLSVGTSTRTLLSGENLFYGNIKSDSNAASNFLLFQNNASTSLFKVASDGSAYFAGSVGIGTTDPQSTLDVYGNGTFGETGNKVRVGFDIMGGDTGLVDIENSKIIAGYLGENYIFGGYENNDGIAINMSSGNVGIGTTSPQTILHVYTATSVPFRIETTSGNSPGFDLYLAGVRKGTFGIAAAAGHFVTNSAANDFVFRPDGGGNFIFSNSAATIQLLKILNAGQVAIGTTTISSALLSLDYGGAAATINAGNSKIQNVATAASSSDAVNYSLLESYVDGALTATRTATLNMGGYDIINVNKLTVDVIDPLYNIKGVNYSTFAPSIAGGLKEEYVDNFKIDTYRPGLGYEGVIDFSDLKVGSDLWVWRQVIDFSPENVQVFLTPYGGFAQTYYLIRDNKLIFRSDKPISVSYRLIGKRFDWRAWPTRANNQTEKANLIIK